MVPSSIMKAWTDGKEAWNFGSLCSDSIMGILRRGKRVGKNKVYFWCVL